MHDNIESMSQTHYAIFDSVLDTHRCRYLQNRIATPLLVYIVHRKGLGVGVFDD